MESVRNFDGQSLYQRKESRQVYPGAGGSLQTAGNKKPGTILAPGLLDRCRISDHQISAGFTFHRLTVFDQIVNSDYGHIMLAGKVDALRSAGHCPVVIG